MKKIVFIVPNLYANGGLERVTINIANELAKESEYEVELLSMNRSASTPRYAIADSIKRHDLPIENYCLRRDFLKVVRELRKLFSADFEGTIIVDDVGHAVPAYFGLKHCKKIKLICWTHTNYFHGKPYGFAGFGKKLTSRKFDSIVVLTKEDKGYYADHGITNNVIQIYNPKDENIIRGKYNLKSKKIISCGRLDKIKGFDLLIEAAKIVFSNVDDWKWDIYGEGPERENLQALITQYGLDGKVNLMGFHKDILAKYHEYAFYVFTSRGEGCPMAMIEALSAGLPMISFDFCCGPRDLIANGVNGFIVEDWNVIEMADRVQQLIRNSELRQKFSDHSDCNLGELELNAVIKKWKRII